MHGNAPKNASKNHDPKIVSIGASFWMSLDVHLEVGVSPNPHEGGDEWWRFYLDLGCCYSFILCVHCFALLFYIMKEMPYIIFHNIEDRYITPSISSYMCFHQICMIFFASNPFHWLLYFAIRKAVEGPILQMLVLCKVNTMVWNICQNNVVHKCFKTVLHS